MSLSQALPLKPAWQLHIGTSPLATTHAPWPLQAAGHALALALLQSGPSKPRLQVQALPGPQAPRPLQAFGQFEPVVSPQCSPM